MAAFTSYISQSASTDHHDAECIKGLIKAGVAQNTLIWPLWKNKPIS